MSSGVKRVANSPDVTKNDVVVIADAGPLIHLDELSALDVLNDFPEILVVPSVQEEIRKHRPELIARCPRLTFTYAVPRNAIVDAMAVAYTLHRGEREALSLCMSQNT